MSPDLLHAEDLAIGTTTELGSVAVTREEVVEFAAQWDPLPFHVDADAAARTPFGDVIGSGVHTLAIYQRLAVLGLYRHWALLAGRALRDVRFLGPLRPGRAVRATATIEAVRPRTDVRSVVTVAGLVLDGEGTILSLLVDADVARRP